MPSSNPSTHQLLSPSSSPSTSTSTLNPTFAQPPVVYYNPPKVSVTHEILKISDWINWKNRFEDRMVTMGIFDTNKRLVPGMDQALKHALK